jgi:catechol 2,3-dioxygenase-like lactoylglutathione lyase family enzyme
LRWFAAAMSQDVEKQLDMAKPRMSGPDYGRSLQGLGFNLIVNDLERAIHFARHVLGAEVFFRTDVFAAMHLSGQSFMFHIPASYRGNELHATLTSDAPRGVGIELRCYAVDPDKAEASARTHGFTVLAGALDKPHGLRECMILDDDGFVWIPSRHLPPQPQS